MSDAGKQQTPGTYGPPWPGHQGPPPGWAYAPQYPRPGVVPLGPLGLGEILGGVFSTLGRYAKPLFGPLAGGLAAALLVVGCYAAAVWPAVHGAAVRINHESRAAKRGDAVQLVGLVGGAALLATVLLVVLSVLATGTSTVVARHAVVGRAVTVRQVMAEARPQFWRVLGVQLLLGLVSAAVLLVCAAPAVVAGVVSGQAAVGVGLGVVLLIPGYPAGIYLQVRMVLAVPVAILEKQPLRAALRRAWALNEGAWWRSLGIPLLVSLIGSFVTQFILMPFGIAGFVVLTESSIGRETPDVAGLAIAVGLYALGVAAAVTASLPLGPLTHALLYVDRRIRREDFGPVLAAESGFADPVQPTAPGV